MTFPKKYLPLLIAAALAVVATFLINGYVQQQARIAQAHVISAQKNIMTAIIARKDIPSGAVVTEDMLAEERVPKDRLQPRAATDIDRVINKITLAPISKGEQILLNKLTLSGQETSLSAKVPRGKRAITIPVDNISSVGGMVRPADHVDVMGVVPIPGMTAEGKQVNQLTTVPLFQDVLVLAVGQEFSAASADKNERRSSYPVITLALSPQEANIIAFMQDQQTKIRLILRSPEDTQIQPTAPVDWQTILKAVMPQYFTEQPESAQKMPSIPKKTVEIIRGQKREIKSLE